MPKRVTVTDQSQLSSKLPWNRTEQKPKTCLFLPSGKKFVFWHPFHSYSTTNCRDYSVTCICGFCKLFKFNAKYVSDIICHRLHSLCHQNSEHVKAIIVLPPKLRQTWTCLMYPGNAHRWQAFFSSLALNRRSHACNYISENPTSDLWELPHFQFH